MNKRVLIVDDDPLILLGMLRMQKRFGYDIEPASSGRQALERIRTVGPFDVVVSDCDMPSMNGLELLRRCRQQAPEMARIMFSGATEGEEIQQAIREGLLFRFIPKPCAPYQFALHLEAALNERRTSVAR